MQFKERELNTYKSLIEATCKTEGLTPKILYERAKAKLHDLVLNKHKGCSTALEDAEVTALTEVISAIAQIYPAVTEG